MQCGRGVGRVRQVQHVNAVAGQGQLVKSARKARTGIAKCNQRTTGHVNTRQRTTQCARGFLHQPVVLEFSQHIVHAHHLAGVPPGLDHPGAHFELIGAQVQNGVVEFALQLERVPAGASLFNRFGCRLNAVGRRMDGDGGDACGAIHQRIHHAVMVAGVINDNLQRCQFNPTFIGI